MSYICVLFLSGEVVIMRECPKDFPFYVMDDDADAGVMQMPDGSLYLSTAAAPTGASVRTQRTG